MPSGHAAIVIVIDTVIVIATMIVAALVNGNDTVSVIDTDRARSLSDFRAR